MVTGIVWVTNEPRTSIIQSIVHAVSAVERDLCKPILVVPASAVPPESLRVVIHKKVFRLKETRAYNRGPRLPTKYGSAEWNQYNAFLLGRAQLGLVLCPGDKDTVVCTKCYGRLKRYKPSHTNMMRHARECEGSRATKNKAALAEILKTLLTGPDFTGCTSYCMFVERDIEIAGELLQATNNKVRHAK